MRSRNTFYHQHSYPTKFKMVAAAILKFTFMAFAGLLLYFSDGDCLMLAQAMDLRTSVRLARTKDVDLRLFRRVPRPPHTNVCVLVHCNSHSY